MALGKKARLSNGPRVVSVFDPRASSFRFVCLFLPYRSSYSNLVSPAAWKLGFNLFRAHILLTEREAPLWKPIFFCFAYDFFFLGVLFIYIAYYTAPIVTLCGVSVCALFVYGPPYFEIAFETHV